MEKETISQENKIGYFISSNWKWLAATLVYMAIAYSQYDATRNNVETNHRRLNTKIEKQNKLEKTIHSLELRLIVLETKIKTLDCNN